MAKRYSIKQFVILLYWLLTTVCDCGALCIDLCPGLKKPIDFELFEEYRFVIMVMIGWRIDFLGMFALFTLV